MANRHLARSVVLQSLFESDMRNAGEDVLLASIRRNATEFAPGVSDVSFMETLAQSVLAKRSELDLIITKAAPDWPIDKISAVDRNILRLGLYELLFADREEVPAKVAINEAIELAKGFGGENSGKFVNGVLGSVYKELGEPGKDAVSKKKDEKFNLPFDKMPIVKLGGAVVYSRHEGQVYLALVHDVFGHWTLSKGSLPDGEDVEVGTINKIKEEIGVDIVIKKEIASNEYVATHPEKGKMRKQVTYFLAETKYGDLKLKETGGLDKAQWFPVEQIAELNFYEDMLPVITKAIKAIPKK
ncbi:MAG: transcription antitermination factor NusB [Candidatus Taylorbacteria bacterium CG10_big_fil_rev_8_21_14_0_10_41_48]|uniref:Transcription antitermination protein NusB n=1 Tax=Candidatus Taylorbacteria bacterium CG10_big_fil_rev_8_21_14_0_10_41_48 TaxID=1975024 RepID=A0A2M8LCB2_9BACT|nr:MAG: transcription antitermination factor NusB [Candidatus Taylorbacteria bacterium CG10_big_fil_rev_8_21_14_0_10_41_48]